MTPIQHLYVRDLMVSIKVLGKLFVEPKTLGWENSRKIFKNAFENLGVASTQLKCFQNGFGQMELGLEDKGVGGLVNRHWCFFVVAQNN
jgi:hypothetical protein